MTIRALVFDAYGTLYDVQSVQSKAEELCPGKGEMISQLWRLKQLEYTWLRSIVNEYEDFWAVTRAALDFAHIGRGVDHGMPLEVEARLVAAIEHVDLRRIADAIERAV